MAISDELNRIIQAKADIKSALEEKGLTIGDSSTLDEFPGLIQEMEVGGGGTTDLIDWIEGNSNTFVIPNGTTSIKTYCFQGLNIINENISIPDSVTTINNNAFSNVSINSIRIPSSVINFGDQLFQNGNINTLTIDSSELKTYLVGSSRRINSLYLLNAVNIKNRLVYANSINSSLNTVYIGPNIETIQNTAFGGNIVSNTATYIILSNTAPNIGGNGAFGGLKNIYVKNSALNTYVDGYWNDISTKIKPLAAIDYDDTTYTVTASGRDNVELYVDASLINSSTYTFTPGAADVSHNITVKSVDPSLGILDTVSQEIQIAGQLTPSATPYIMMEEKITSEEVDILDEETGEPTGETETIETNTGMYRVMGYIPNSQTPTQYVTLTVNGEETSNPTEYDYPAGEGWETTDSSVDATIVATATCQEPGKAPTTVTYYFIESHYEEPEPEEGE